MSRVALVLAFVCVTLLVPASQASAQSSSSQRGTDSLWNGLLIGAVAGGLGGFILAPRMLCGTNDQECSAIVKVAIGLPAFFGGMATGGLLDKFHAQGHTVWKSGSGMKEVTLAPVLGRETSGVRIGLRFRLRR